MTIVQAGSPDRRRLDIKLRELEPNGVYTDWLSEEGTTGLA